METLRDKKWRSHELCHQISFKRILNSRKTKTQFQFGMWLKFRFTISFQQLKAKFLINWSFAAIWHFHQMDSKKGFSWLKTQWFIILTFLDVLMFVCCSFKLVCNFGPKMWFKLELIQRMKNKKWTVNNLELRYVNTFKINSSQLFHCYLLNLFNQPNCQPTCIIFYMSETASKKLPLANRMKGTKKACSHSRVIQISCNSPNDPTSMPELVKACVLQTISAIPVPKGANL